MACLVASLFLASVSQTIIAAVMPLIVADLGGFDRYAWAAAAYLVTATVTYPIVGRLSDAYGRKPFLVLGLAAFVAGTALVSLSQSMNQIIAFRAFQGVGGGMVTTCCHVAIADLFPPAERARFHGMIGAVYGLSSVAGPVLGGIAAERSSWEWPFFLVAIAGVPVTWLATRTYPAPVRRGDPGSIDVAGMLMLVPAVVSLTLALSAGGDDLLGGPSVRVVLLAVGMAAAAVLVFVEIRSESPIMPLKILADRLVAVCVVVSLLTSFCLYGSVFYLPAFAQIVLGRSVAGSAALLLPMLLGTVTGGILAGQLLSRAGPRYRLLAVASGSVMLAGTVLTTTIDTATSSALIATCVALTGGGFGGLASTFSVAVQNTVPFRFVGAATSALQFYRSLGGMAGLAVLGGLLSRRFGTRLDQMMTDSVRAALPDDRFTALRRDPVALVEPKTADALRSDLAATGTDGATLGDSLLESLRSAFALAMGDVFAVVAALTALALGVVLLFPLRGQPAVPTGPSG